MSDTKNTPVVKATKVSEPTKQTKKDEVPLVDVPEVRKDELTTLKEFATKAGVKVEPEDTISSLKEKIDKKMNPKKETNPTTPLVETNEVVKKPESKMEIRRRIQAEALKLVRVSVICHNPNKREYDGEIFTVQNKHIGTVRKMVPFGKKSEKGFHVPQVLLNVIKERKFQQITTRKEGSQTIVDTALVPEFTVVVLPPLTDEERKELADQQAASARITGS